MKIYIVTCVNEDAWVNVVGAYTTYKRACRSMDIDRNNTAESLEQEGYIVSTGRDESSAIVRYGNDHFYRYKITAEEVIK